MKVELKGIEVAIGDKSTKLTIAEAQELRRQLNELFGEKITYVPSYPIVIEREVWPWWRCPSTVTYTSKIPDNGVAVYCCTE